MLRCFRAARGQIVLIGTVLLALYFVVWHGQHLAAALPVVVVLACPLMHLFMHGGHRHHSGARPAQGQSATSKATLEETR